MAGAQQTRIALLVPDLRIGGTERLTLNLASELSRRDYCVDIVLVREQGELLEEIPEAVRIVALGARRMRYTIPPLTRYLNRNKPAALLAAMWPLTIFAILATRIARSDCRVVVSEHNTLSSIPALGGLRGLLARATIRTLYPCADGIVAVSRGMAQDLAAFGGLNREAITVIYNPACEPRTKNNVRTRITEAWTTGEHAKIVNVGSLKEQKDHHTLLEAVKTLSEELAVRLLILGDGPLREELEAEVTRLGLTHVVFMPGNARNPFPFLRTADLFVLSSKYEGFGIVLAEALQCGTPIVSTDCPSGPREVLQDGKYGKLVPVGDVDALAQAMLESLKSPPASQLLVERGQVYSLERAADEYLDMLLPRSSD